MILSGIIILVDLIITAAGYNPFFYKRFTRENYDYDVVLISKRSHPAYHFKAFGQDIHLNLRPNDKLLAPGFRALVVDGDQFEDISDDVTVCHYTHASGNWTAALSLCHPREIHGLVLLEDSVLEIAPLGGNLGKDNVPHVVKRAQLIPANWTEELRPIPFNIKKRISSYVNQQKHSARKRKKVDRPTVEAALFFDEAAYKIFSPYFKHNDKKLRDMLLAYMNGVQALYHHPSAGIMIDITLTRLEMFKSQPPDLPHYSGERGSLLDSFCAYNAKKNPAKDTDPQHWDMGLYISGLDFHAVENGKRSGVTMGLATVGGVCQPKYACVIAEFGVTNMLGKPYPSAGFTSVYVLAHEMGHNLGMHHDSSSNSCPKDGFIMSPSRGTNGETSWSYCSAEILKTLSDWAKCLYDKQKPPTELDHSKFKDAPGTVWGPKKQCEILLRDADAEFVGSDKKEVPEICQSLECRTPHRSGFYFAGPALDGSVCGHKKRCQGGVCAPSKSPSLSVGQSGDWGPWTLDKCQSACISGSKGYQASHRQCHSNDGCSGAGFSVSLCDDNNICKNYRRSAELYATDKCLEFSNYLPELKRDGEGLQAPHENGRPWMACVIFCQRKDGGSFYTPRLELNDLGKNPYFPDGTWCHNDGSSDYYCIRHHCLPENFPITKDSFPPDELEISQNAPPFLKPLPKDFQQYLSLNANGQPMLTTISPRITPYGSDEDDWVTLDYIELPEGA